MICHDTEARSLFARERADLLASEMRRVRGLSPEQAGYPSWTARAAALLDRAARRIRRHKGHKVPVYDA